MSESFFNKLQASAYNFIKKETMAHVFSCKFCEISKNTFFTEHLRETACFFAYTLILIPTLEVFVKSFEWFYRENFQI